MTKRQKYVIVAVLAVACLVVYVRNWQWVFAAPAFEMREWPATTEWGMRRAGAVRAEARAVAGEFWQGDPVTLRNTIKRTIEELARDSRVELSTTGAARNSTVSDHIQAVDVAIAATTDTRAVTAFLKAIEDYAPLLEVADLVLERTHDGRLRLTGTVRAYLLDSATSKRLGEG